MPRSILRAVRQASMLVIVATTAAGKSKAVRDEIETFLTTRRLIVPIDLDGTITQADWWPLLEGLAISIEEAASDGRIATRPSREVLDRIENSINFTRRNERLRRVTIATLVILALLIAGAIVATRIAASARDENKRLTEQNGTANTQLAETQSRLVASEAEYAKQKELTAKATEQRMAADNQLAASKAKLERQTAIAESQELARLAPSAPTERQRINEAVKAVQRSPTEAARLNLAQILLHSIRTTSRTDVAIGHEGQQVAVVSGSGDAKYFDLSNQAEFRICGHPEPIDMVNFSNDGKYLVTGSADGSKSHVVQIWDVSRGVQTGISEISGLHEERRVDGRSFSKSWISPDDSRLLLYWADSLYILEMPTGRILSTVRFEGRSPHVSIETGALNGPTMS